MKRLTVYWRNGPEDLDVLSVVDHVRVGVDEEEVLTTDQGAEVIRAMAREFDDAFIVDSITDLDPHNAADLICQYIPRQKARQTLQRLIAMVSQEDDEAADSLSEDFEDLLHSGGQ